MNKTFLITLAILFTCLCLNCRNGITDESNVITTSSNFDTGLPAQGLIAYYPFNGTADDASGNGNNGTNSGAILTSDRFGYRTSAYHFTNGAYIRIPDLFPATVSGFTFAVWVMKDTLDGQNHEIIFKGASQGETAIGITGPLLGFGVCLGNDPYNWHSAIITDTLKARTWYFLVGRYTKGQKAELIVNGYLACSLAIQDLYLYQDASSIFNPSVIGTVPSQANDGWNGIIDDIRVYNRALSDAEVQALYHEGGW
jgi:Concanavalin A-like lectin/glucanases superfamily